MSYPVIYEIREDGVYLVCRAIPDAPGVVAEMRVPDDLVAAWLEERPEFCSDCGGRLANVGGTWCPECMTRPPVEQDGTFWG